MQANKWLYQIGGNFGDSSIYRLLLKGGEWQRIPGEGLGCGQAGVLDLMGQMRVSSREDYRNHSFLVFGGIDNDKIDNKTT